ncbi:hypothetical protein ACFUT3_01385 [Streptomyces cinereoruber]|uniref:hypothetical protein n=1 Tax=Streptomyces cinereoruber TaxID=67260 RepID=UPI0036435289
MIPATTPYVARYRQTADLPNGTQGSYTIDRPVLAWNDDGHALVAADERGQLVPASGYSNFDGVMPAEPHIMAVLPATGWLAQYKDDGDGSIFTRPVLAFLVKSDGGCRPVMVDSQGFTDDARDSENFVQLIDPGEQEAEA